MKKYILGLLLMISTLTGYGKCDWSTLKLQQYNNRNYYSWKVSGAGIGDDSCVGWMFMVYDFQTKKIDTLQDWRGVTEVQFNKKGKYKMYLKVWNSCLKCDTAIMREVTIQYFDKVKTYMAKTACNRSIFEMTKATTVLTDTCYDYYYYVYSGKFFDGLTKTEWDSITDSQIFALYSFEDGDLDTFKQGRLFEYTYPKNGRYYVISQCFNKCNNQDTFYGMKVTIDCGGTMAVENIVKAEDLKIVGYYDMLGRQVDYMEPDKVYIVRYSNGKNQKVVRTK